ncbi:MAG: hypothetical protein N2643_03615 [Endomicrobia bacterium]|nr:hypothetical protein [Endomicrobiia bacterium]
MKKNIGMIIYFLFGLYIIFLLYEIFVVKVPLSVRNNLIYIGVIAAILLLLFEIIK